MVSAALPPRRDSIAIAASIVIHLCVLTAFVALPRPSFPANDPDERTLLTTIIRIEHRPTPPPIAVAPRVRPEPAARPSAPLPVIHAAVTAERAARKLVVAPEQRAASAPSPSAARKHQADGSVTRLALAAARPPAAAAERAATPAPAASPAASPIVAQREEGIGNFGETYPPALDPSARGSLLAGVNGILVRITVDENGRATSIEFLRPPPDAVLREELRTRLLAARFVPAACNGLRCAGTVDLKN